MAELSNFHAVPIVLSAVVISLTQFKEGITLVAAWGGHSVGLGLFFLRSSTIAPCGRHSEGLTSQIALAPPRSRQLLLSVDKMLGYSDLA